MKNVNELLDKEKNLQQELARCKELVNLYRFQLNKFIEPHAISNGLSKKIHHYQQLFAYYQQDLIPALEETVRLGKKHVELVKKNPDKSFKPVKLEVKNHFKLMKQFFSRFEQVEREFEAFKSVV